jgi:hypothetical protein
MSCLSGTAKAKAKKKLSAAVFRLNEFVSQLTSLIVDTSALMLDMRKCQGGATFRFLPVL